MNAPSLTVPATPTRAIALRPYQREALRAVRTQYAAGVRRMLLVAATGAGKTIVFAHLAAALNLPSEAKILVLAHRDELVMQARDKYRLVNPGEWIGVEAAAARVGPLDRVAIASVQSLQGRRLHEFLVRFGRPALVVTDEAHHATASTYRAIYDTLGIAAQGDVVHVGVTATPQRSDDVSLGAIFDVVAHAVGIEDLIAQEYLVPLLGYRVQTNVDLDAVRTTAGDFNGEDLGRIINTSERNAGIVAAYLDVAAGRKAIAFAASIEHSRALQAAFAAAGVPATHVDGAMSLQERRARLAAFSAGEDQGAPRVLCNCAVATEGYDEPSVSCVILARPTKSAVLVTQMVGRATRLHPGKENAVVIDVSDATKRHSVATLAAMFGFARDFDFAGHSVTEIAERRRRVVDESPEVASVLHDVAALERAEHVAAGDRFPQALAELLTEARKKQSYVDVNLLARPELDDDTLAMTSLVWTNIGPDVYALRSGDDTVYVTCDLVGGATLRVRRTVDNRTKDHVFGTFPRVQAFAHAEAWIKRHHADNLVLVDRAARWRTKPASEKQVAALQRFRVANPETLKSGAASALLDDLFRAKRRT